MTLDELRERFKTAATHDERTRWQALMLLSDPTQSRSRKGVAQIVGRSLESDSVGEFPGEQE